MASRAAVVICFLAAVPFLCLELQRGIPEIEDGEENKRRQLVRKKQQEAQIAKASRYTENILKPRQEMKLKKLEERFYQMTGETWKLTSGHKLGRDENLVLEDMSQTSLETPNREAAKSRNLPNAVIRDLPPADQSLQKEVPDLPEEPSETADAVVTVALRCPNGRILRRRFLKSCSSQVLFAWMMKTGYHTSLYSLFTSFPRRLLEVEGGWSLADIGITMDTLLTVGEKEHSN
ncbi:UBX domain-containing protein 8 isoform X3 [Octodon degus]|uniref:UBX domain-containing protein 8 isoform X3 n=1 Tax=Octodon degus TaxID=10160 RepID=A0A6P6EMU7_OCTDE|nr:UBX domain-containing protein 8 isoform X3 [Octodon degus]